MDGEHPHTTPPSDGASTDVAALQAELAEAKRIGAWLYARVPPGLRRHLGDVSEWPWLLDGEGGRMEGHNAHPVPGEVSARDQAVLRAFAELQAGGGDVYFAAEYVAALLGLTPEEFDAALAHLLAGQLVEGGRTFRRSFVERVTPAGVAAAEVAGDH